jgi:TPR repeat protein
MLKNSFSDVRPNLDHGKCDQYQQRLRSMIESFKEQLQMHADASDLFSNAAEDDAREICRPLRKRLYGARESEKLKVLRRISRTTLPKFHEMQKSAAAEAEAERRMTPIQKQQRDYLKWLAKPLADLMKASLDGDAAAQCVMGYKCATGKAGGEKIPEKEKPVIDENDFAGAQKRREEEEAEKKNKEGKPDYKAAAIWYQRSAAQGFALAQGAMGCFLFDGRGVAKKSRMEGLKYYKLAAEQGLPDACYCVGDSYEFGRGCLVNLPEAIVWYRKAIEFGDCARSKAALDRLGFSYDGEKERIESEQKAAKDAADAIQRARMAAAAAVADAKRKLALKQIKFGGVEKKE